MPVSYQMRAVRAGGYNARRTTHDAIGGESVKQDSQNASRGGPRVCVVIRRSPDWGRMSREEFEQQARDFCRQVQRPVEQVVETARLWDETFRMSYCETRQALKAIAQMNLARVAIDGVSWGLPPSVEPDTIYVLTDDDDWLSPELPRALTAAAPGACDGVVWGTVMLGPIRKDVDEPVLEVPAWMRLPPLDTECRSNNYAVTGRYFARPGAGWNQVLDHGRAGRTFRSLQIVTLSRYLSIKNTNPASTVFLENGLRRDFSRARLQRLVQQYSARLDGGRASLDPQLRWAEASITALGELFRELLNGAR